MCLTCAVEAVHSLYRLYLYICCTCFQKLATAIYNCKLCIDSSNCSQVITCDMICILQSDWCLWIAEQPPREMQIVPMQTMFWAISKINGYILENLAIPNLFIPCMQTIALAFVMIMTIIPTQTLIQFP